jgi:hypothetical protein
LLVQDGVERLRKAPRDTWPSLEVKVELMPWAWRLAYYRDDIEPYYVWLNVGPIEIAFGANRPMFFEKRSDWFDGLTFEPEDVGA